MPGVMGVRSGFGGAGGGVQRIMPSAAAGLRSMATGGGQASQPSFASAYQSPYQSVGRIGSGGGLPPNATAGGMAYAQGRAGGGGWGAGQQRPNPAQQYRPPVSRAQPGGSNPYANPARQGMMPPSAAYRPAGQAQGGGQQRPNPVQQYRPPTQGSLTINGYRPPTVQRSTIGGQPSGAGGQAAARGQGVGSNPGTAMNSGGGQGGFGGGQQGQGGRGVGGYGGMPGGGGGQGMGRGQGNAGMGGMGMGGYGYQPTGEPDYTGSGGGYLPYGSRMPPSNWGRGTPPQGAGFAQAYSDDDMGYQTGAGQDQWSAGAGTFDGGGFSNPNIVGQGYSGGGVNWAPTGNNAYYQSQGMLSVPQMDYRNTPGGLQN